MNKLPLKAYIWDIKTLKNAIFNDKLTQKEQLIFYFLFTSVTMLLTRFPATYKLFPYYWGFFQKFISIPIFCIAVIIAYRYNGGSKGKDFIFRFIALDWLVFVRIAIFFTIPILIVYYGAYKNMPYDLWIKLRIIIGIFISIFAYWRICVNIKDIAENEKRIRMESAQIKTL